MQREIWIELVTYKRYCEKTLNNIRSKLYEEEPSPHFESMHMPEFTGVAYSVPGHIKSENFNLD